MPAFEHFSLAGKTAVVTGGATGLGYGMTRALARAGATVVIGARRAALLREAVAELLRDPLIADVRCHVLDLEDPGSVQGFATHVLETTQGVDIFIGNAAIVLAEQVADIKQDAITRLVQTNFAANVQLTQAFIPGMQARGWGRLIFSSSVASNLAVPQEGNIIYSATKAGLNALTRSLAADLGRQGITANALILGLFRTELLLSVEAHFRATEGDAVADAFMAAFIDGTAVGRLGEPTDLDGIVQLLASDAGAFISGTTIPVDGGMSIMLRPYRHAAA